MIQAENLSMWYGPTRALADASFEVRSGEVLGLLGPNGAGKTTTLKILTTFIQPSSGRVIVDGIDASEDPLAVRRKIGYLPETAPLYVDMLVSEYLGFVGRARGLAGEHLDRRRADVVESCGLERVYNRPIAHLSKGFRQRVGLAQALIHDPEIVILDEPTSGLDPLQIVGIRQLVRELAREKTVMFSTHILQEIDAVSDRVMIINEGKIIAVGAPSELERRAMGTDRLAVEVDADPGELESRLGGLPGVLAVERRPPSSDATASCALRFDFGERDVPRRAEEVVREAGWSVHHLARDPYTLEEVFISIVHESSPSGGAETGAPEPEPERPPEAEGAAGGES